MAEPSLLKVSRATPLAAGALVSIGLVPAATRFSFRGSPDAAAVCGEAFGCALPGDACRASEQGERAALWLGPDEWLLLGPEAAAAAMLAEIESALDTVPHALVDISHRQVGFAITGAEACAVLNAGCPLDLDLAAFPAGMCTRTVLAKSDVTLWRQAPDRFRLETNRSFADYVAAYLRMAERGV